MRKYFFIFFLILSISLTVASQSGYPVLRAQASPNYIPSTAIAKFSQQKAAGDTLHYEDFSNPNLSNWSVVDSNFLSFNWIWSTSPPGGQYSTNISALNSATASNGFISLPADFYNTPYPSGGPVAMHAYIISKAIPIIPKARIEISYQQAIRYCCNVSNRIDLEISTDSVNWISFNSNYNRPPSSSGPNGELMTIDASAILANQDTAFVRFRMQGNSHYFWMIDDLTIKEPPPFSALLTDMHIDPYSNVSPFINHTIIPDNISTCRQKLNVGVSNSQNIAINNVHVSAELYLDSVYHSSVSPGFVTKFRSDSINLAPRQNHEFQIELDRYQAYGEYSLIVRSEADSVNQYTHFPSKIDTLRYIYGGDSVFAKDYGIFMRSVGPRSFISVPLADGIRYGTLFKAGDSAFTSNWIASSLSVYISSDSSNIGVALSPRLYEVGYINLNLYDSLGLNLIANSPFSVTIQASMLDSWVTLPFFPLANLNQSTLVVAAVEQTGGAASGKTFRLGMDESSWSFGRNFIFDTTSWRYVGRAAGIRMNLQSNIAGGCGFVSLEENQKQTEDIEIYPNPSDGLFQISNVDDFRSFEVFDLKGRMVESGNLQPDRSQFDLSSLNEGLYLIRFEGGESMVMKKILIQK